jgi:hypothetical protein
VQPDLYHPLLYIVFHNNIQVSCFDSSHTFCNFNKANYSNISYFISKFDWLSTLSAFSLDSVVNTLYDAFHQSILRFVPMHIFSPSTHPAWFTKKLKEIIFLNKKHMQNLNPLLTLMIIDLFHLLRSVISTSSKGVIVDILIELNCQLIQIIPIFGNV